MSEEPESPLTPHIPDEVSLEDLYRLLLKMQKRQVRIEAKLDRQSIQIERLMTTAGVPNDAPAAAEQVVQGPPTPDLSGLPDLMPLPPCVARMRIPFRKIRRDEIDGAFVAAHEGPSDDSNWLIPGVLLMSAYPSYRQPAFFRRTLEAHLKAGITVWVCLQPSYELKEPRFVPYRGPLMEIARRKKFVGTCVSPSTLEFIHFPVTDNSVPRTLERTKQVVAKICDRIRAGRKVLLHCWGGHGRTGTIVSFVLGSLYSGLSATQILRRVEVAHDSRKEYRGSKSPQVDAQFRHVVRFLGPERNDTKYPIRRN